MAYLYTLMYESWYMTYCSHGVDESTKGSRDIRHPLGILWYPTLQIVNVQSQHASGIEYEFHQKTEGILY